jgi:threonine dehydrogenase-like Zn-dependent dehydrogenase
LARQHARRQRRERAAGVVIVCLGIVVLIVAVLALREPKGHVSVAATSGSASSVAKQSRAKAPSHNATTSTSSATSRTRAVGSTSSVKNVPLIVLNNSTIKGLAAQAAQRFENGGWKVTGSGNLTNEIVSTCAYYDESDPQAKQAAEALQAQYPAIKRVRPKFPELPSGPVVVVLTRDYAAA